ncbi:MAG: AbrB/MazE/SpoVT family DNA-binding domain-containing protein [Deltaproteobacteria bacterium]|nr:AbrB/MazE/SpoVT family DNA-binding domain-containing protein [Deltaproteobacteria bacterium]
MDTLTVSSSFRVVIPKRIIEALSIQPGQSIRLFAHGDRIELLPVRPMQELRGFLRGIDTDVPREGGHT